MKDFMKPGATTFLRMAVLALGIVALVLSYLILPAVHNYWELEYPEVAYLHYPVLVGLSLTTIPFFVALYQTLKLLQYIDVSKAFSELSVKALSYIKYSALIFSVLYAALLLPIYYVAQHVDAPGVMVIGTVMSFAPLVIAVFTAVLQKLLQNAITLKSEHDLTI